MYYESNTYNILFSKNIVLIWHPYNFICRIDLGKKYNKEIIEAFNRHFNWVYIFSQGNKVVLK